MPLMVSSPVTTTPSSPSRTMRSERKVAVGCRSASKNSGESRWAVRSAWSVVTAPTGAVPVRVAPSGVDVSTAWNSGNAPWNVDTTMCRTANPTDEWIGSLCQVPAGMVWVVCWVAVLIVVPPEWTSRKRTQVRFAFRHHNGLESG